MLTLGINTSGSFTAVCIVKDRRLLDEQLWKSNKDESEKLLTHIEGLLARNRYTLKDLTRIVVVSGPGPFSAVRIGVTVAHVLSYALNIALYGLDTVTLWRKKSQNISGEGLLYAGGNYVAHFKKTGKVTLHPLEKIKNRLSSRKKLVFFGDLPENAHVTLLPETALRSWGELLATLPAAELKKARNGIVTPTYWQPPHITLSPKKYV